MQDLKAAGKDAAYLPDVDAIVAQVREAAAGRREWCSSSATAALAAFTASCFPPWAAASQ